ncbi:hypothetical protein [Thiolinea disciformis]|uniref:hypothetical protein n=1 Tax=Thiolinea disciformis TaxID=125614 RepID=UPI000362AA12|nr:hypothetical protein [Thiolinea disciformis]
MTNSVRVATFNSLAEAEIARGILEANHIPCVVYGYSSERPHLNLSMGVPIAVAPHDHAKASELLAISFNGSLAQGAQWACTQCTETIEAQFVQCWNCGANRPI